MYPLYRNMEAYPCQKKNMCYSPYYVPSFDALPPQMKADPERTLPSYESWPWAGDYGYAYPAQCHGCCNQNYFPGYNVSRTPYAYATRPYWHENYPGIGSYPVHFIPPPHPPLYLPRYEYDKNVPSDHHCCGCPNHQCNKKEEIKEKIEEQDPDSEKMGANPGVTPELKNFPYPVVWFPSGYIQNNDSNKLNDAEGIKLGKNHNGANLQEQSRTFEQQPYLWKGSPHETNNVGQLKKREMEKGSKAQGGSSIPLSFPIFWMPYKPGEMESKELMETNNDSRECTQGSATHFSPMRLPEDKENKNTTEENKGSDGSKMAEANGVRKTIPVKQAEQLEDKVASKTGNGKVGSSVIDQVTNVDSEEDKLVEGTARRSSSPKTSKLPPVCLRVDPLPRKKNPKGTSRSPSPPGDKASLTGQPDSKMPAQPPLKGDAAAKNKELESSKSQSIKEKRESESSVATQQQQGNDKQAIAEIPIELDSSEDIDTTRAESPGKVQSTRDVLTNAASGELKKGILHHSANVVEEMRSGGHESHIESGQDQLSTEAYRTFQDNEVTANKATESKALGPCTMSDVEAAVLIQSAYRGFEVRKWDTLKKLKQIGQIKEKVSDIKSRIRALELHPEVPADNKEKVVVSETIMSLLLKLDTIQGLHPSIRDARKSVAKELVSLQEKLDAIANRNPEVPLSEALTTKSEDEYPKEIKSNASDGGELVEKRDLSGELSKNVQETEGDAALQCPNRSCLDHKSSSSDPEDVEISDTIIGKEMGDNLEVETKTLPENNLTSHAAGSGLEDGAGEGESELDEVTEVKSKQEKVPDDRTAYEIAKVETEDELGQSFRCTTSENADNLSNLSTGVRSSTVTENDKDECPQKVPEIDISSDNLVEKAQTENEGGIVLDKMKNNLDVGHSGNDVSVINGQRGPVTSELIDYIRCQGNKEENAESPSKAEIKLPEVSVETLAEDGSCLNKLPGSPGTDGKVEPTKDVYEISIEAPAEDGSCLDELSGSSGTKGNVEPTEDVHILGGSGDELIGCSGQLKPKTINTSNELMDMCAEIPLGTYSKSGRDVDGADVTNGKTDASYSSMYNNVSTGDIEMGEQNLSGPSELQGLEPETMGTFTEQAIDGSPEKDTDEGPEVQGSKSVVEAEDSGPAGSNYRADSSNLLPQAEQENLDNTEHVANHNQEKGQAEEVVLYPISPTGSQVSLQSDSMAESDKRVIEENEKLRQMMDKLIATGTEQLAAISKLSGRVKDLEKKLSRKKRLKMRQHRPRTPGSSCLKSPSDPSKPSALGISM